MPDYTVQDLIRREAQASGIPPELALAVAEQESSFNPTAQGPEITVNGQKTRALGTFQLLPSTAAMYKVDPNDPLGNIQGGTRYLKDLFERHQGDVDKVLAEYGGVRTNTTYVPGVLARMAKFRTDPTLTTEGRLRTTTLPTNRPTTVWENLTGEASRLPSGIQEELDHFRAVQAGQTPPPRPPTPLWSDEGWLHTAGLDPRDPEDRSNVGGTVGGLAGMAAGSFFGPLGALGGRYAGAAIGGAAGQAYNEFFGPPPKPGDYDSAAKRIAGAGGEQLAWETVPDVLTGPAKWFARGAVEHGVSKAAKDTYATLRKETTAGWDTAIDKLKTLNRDTNLKLQNTSADLTIKRRDELARAKAAAAKAADPEQAQLAAAEKALADAREAARVNKRGVVRSTMADVRTARKQGQAGVAQAQAFGQGAREVMQSDFLREAASRQVGQIPAGQKVLDVVAGKDAPVSLAKSRLGDKVATTAAAGGPVHIGPTKREAYRLLSEELQPVTKTFPLDVPQTTHLAEPRLHGPDFLEGVSHRTPPRVATEDPRIAEFLRGLEGTQLTELQKHGGQSMTIISKILNAPDDVPMGQLHQWYSELRSANDKIFEPGMKSKVEGMTKHLIGELRGALASAKNKPYEKASAEYKGLIDLFKTGRLEDIQKAAVSGPEKIVQLLDETNPSQVKAMLEILREVPKQARGKGAKKGKQAGLDAAAAVQEAWFNRNVLDGDIEGLAERLTKLDTNFEFRDALLDGDYTQVLENTRKLAKAWQTLSADDAARVAKAKLGKTTGVETAQERARQAIYQQEAIGEKGVKDAKTTVSARQAEVEAARTKAEATVGNVRAGHKGPRDAQAKLVRTERARGAQELQDLRTKAKAAAQPTADEEAFAKSSISPENLNAAKGNAYTLIRRAATAAAGLHTLGLGGIGLLFLEKGGNRASRKDLLKYVVHSNEATQRLVKLATSQKTNAAVTNAARVAGHAAGVTPADLEEKRKKAAQASSGISLTISARDK